MTAAEDSAMCPRVADIQNAHCEWPSLMMAGAACLGAGRGAADEHSRHARVRGACRSDA